MHDPYAVADLLIRHFTARYPQNIDLIGYYGSRARGDARPDSDLDIFYVPAEGVPSPQAYTFLLQGRLYDFWPLPWPVLAEFATGTRRSWAFAPALVFHTQILYSRNQEADQRLAALKAKIVELQQPAAKPDMVARALRAFAPAQTHLGNLQAAAETGDLAGARYAGWLLITTVLESLALANQTFFHRGLAASLQELEHLQERPVGLTGLITTLATAGDADQLRAAAHGLLDGTRQTLVRIQRQTAKPTAVKVAFHQAYPELKDAMGKVLAACRAGDELTAQACAWNLQRELTLMLHSADSGHADDGFNTPQEIGEAYRSAGFPDLLDGPPDLPTLAQGCREIDEHLRRLLQEENVALNEFDSEDELRHYLQHTV